MNVFNQEPDTSVDKLQVILLLSRQEARTLIDMADAAVKSNKRKTTWKRLYDKLDLVACY